MTLDTNIMPSKSSDGIIFNSSPKPTLGVEVELQIIDPKTGAAVNRAQDVFKAVDHDFFFKTELFQSIFEITTDICADVAEVERDLGGKLKQAKVALDSLGLSAIGAGVHPFTTWRDLEISPDPRYKKLVDTMAWPARRLAITGLHVHVGIDSGEKAIQVVNAARSFIPHMLAISASTPFWMGEKTGLASTRTKVFEGLPTAGLPPRLTNWSDFISFMRTLINGGTIQTIREVWWDVRPHPGFGTVEIRVCDGVSSFEEILGLVAMIQALVVWFGDLYDNGDELPILKQWTVQQNKWRGARWAEEANIIVNEHGAQAPLRGKMDELIRLLENYAKDLGSLSYLEKVPGFMENPSYKRQLKVFEETQSLLEVTKHLQREWETWKPEN
jgi:carboxylate-amine ligase